MTDQKAASREQADTGRSRDRSTVAVALALSGQNQRLATLTCMAQLEKRGSYTPRRARERRAYQLVVGGSVAGGVGIVGVVLAITGVVGAALPIIAFIVAALCVLGFMRTVGAR